MDCEWSSWGDYTRCTVTCGNGTQIKTRTKLGFEKHGGSCPGLSHEKQQCNTAPCPRPGTTHKCCLQCSGPIHYLRL